MSSDDAHTPRRPSSTEPVGAVEPRGPDAATAEREALIRALVFEFYGLVRRDPLLGPVFDARLAGDWDAHLEKMCDFWSGILYATGRFRGDPIRTHAAIPDITPGHFDRWLELFEETARRTLPPALASDVIARSHRMRVALERSSCREAASPP